MGLLLLLPLRPLLYLSEGSQVSQSLLLLLLRSLS
jgi:hypothetical protein